MAISNLIAKINENTELEVQAILDKASQEEKAIINKRVQIEAKQEKEILLERAKREAKNKADRIISSADLKVRNDILAAKQTMIEKIFEMALEKLNNLGKDELYSFIKQSIINTSIMGEAQLVLSKAYCQRLKAEFVNDINSEMKSLGRNANFSLIETDQSNVFVIRQNGIDMNYSFESIISNLKEEMEFEVNKHLFQ